MKIVICIIFTVTSSLLYSQEVHPDRAYFESYYKDLFDYVKAPVQWQANDWLVLGGVLGTGVLLYTQDDEIQDFFQRNKTPFWNGFSKHVAEPVGSGKYAISALAVLYIDGVIAKRPKSKKVALLGVKASILSGVLYTSIKLLTHRQRPSEGKFPDARVWEGPGSYFKKLSFPSGHTTNAFAIATVVARSYKDVKWVPVASYTIATLAGLSRIYDNKHWASDVLIGAALGWSLGSLIVKENNWGIQVSAHHNKQYSTMGLMIPLAK